MQRIRIQGVAAACLLSIAGLMFVLVPSTKPSKPWWIAILFTTAAAVVTVAWGLTLRRETLLSRAALLALSLSYGAISATALIYLDLLKEDLGQDALLFVFTPGFLSLLGFGALIVTSQRIRRKITE